MLLRNVDSVRNSLFTEKTGSSFELVRKYRQSAGNSLTSLKIILLN